MMRRFVAMAGGAERADIVVFPMASAEPESTGIRQATELRSLGAKNARSVVLTRAQALSEEGVRALDGVTGVFFSGGDQSRLMKVLLETPVHARLLELYREGAVMGGTSAGAAVMSRVMITGDERLNKDSTESFTFIRKGNIVTAQGLGFLENVIVDQHFVRRKRHNRLISLVLEQPGLVGMGIDEATVLVVTEGKKFEVMGEGSVLVLDARAARDISANEGANLSARDILLHVLTDGQTFVLERPGGGR
jgi:cyanophycinase